MNTENVRAGSFLVSEGNGTISRDQITLLAINDASTVYQAGKVLGKRTKAGTAVAAIVAGSTGNGAAPTVTVGAGALLGVTRFTCIKATADSGTFEALGPNGVQLPNMVIGAPYAQGGLSFTWPDGATDFVVGDGLTVTVAAGDGKYVAFNPAGTHGEEVAAAILYDYRDVSGATDVKAAAITRYAEVASTVLDWGSANGGQVTVGTAQLAALGIIVRTSV